jgi:hypothetical protein
MRYGKLIVAKYRIFLSESTKLLIFWRFLAPAQNSYTQSHPEQAGNLSRRAQTVDSQWEMIFLFLLMK